jgi:lipopolysaccharide transport system permease protein
LSQRHPDVAGAVWTLVRTDFKVRYHGTLLGFFWALSKPLLILGVLLVVFRYLFSTTPNYTVDLVIGIFLYEFFSEATKSGLMSLQQKGYLLTRSTFPRWILVVTSSSNALVTLVAFSVGVVVFLAALGRPPFFNDAATTEIYTAHFVVIVIGFSLAASVIFVRFRDLNQVWEVLVQMGFFFAPVIYPLEILPEWMHIYLYVWPPTPILEFSRSALTGEALPSLKAHLLLVGLALGSLAVGLVIYRRLVGRAAEYL